MLNTPTKSLPLDNMVEFPHNGCYLVSRCGAIWSRATERFITKGKNACMPHKWNSARECWDTNTGRSTWPLSRVLATTFLGEPPASVIGFKDGDKANNSLDNLEWISFKESSRRTYMNIVKPKGKDHHLYGIKKTKQAKYRMKLAKLGERHPRFAGWWIVNGRKYPSTGAAARDLGWDAKKVYRHCKERREGCYYLDKEKLEATDQSEHILPV